MRPGRSHFRALHCTVWGSRSRLHLHLEDDSCSGDGTPQRRQSMTESIPPVGPACRAPDRSLRSDQDRPRRRTCTARDPNREAVLCASDSHSYYRSERSVHPSARSRSGDPESETGNQERQTAIRMLRHHRAERILRLAPTIRPGGPERPEPRCLRRSANERSSQNNPPLVAPRQRRNADRGRHRVLCCPIHASEPMRESPASRRRTPAKRQQESARSGLARSRRQLRHEPSSPGRPAPDPLDPGPVDPGCVPSGPCA